MPSSRTAAPKLGLGLTLYRGLRWLMLIVFIIGAWWGYETLIDPAQFPIKIVKIQAEYQHVSHRELQQAILPEVSKGFFNLNTSHLTKTLLELPWVAKAEVRRVWPNTVIIRINEQKALAIFADKALINAQGQIFTPAKITFPANLPALNSKPEQVALLWQYYTQIMPLLATVHLTIVTLDLDERTALTLGLNNGIKVFVGQNQIVPRVERFVRAYPHIFTPTAAPADSVDLRYENGLAVKWSENNKTV